MNINNHYYGWGCNHERGIGRGIKNSKLIKIYNHALVGYWQYDGQIYGMGYSYSVGCSNMLNGDGYGNEIAWLLLNDRLTTHSQIYPYDY